MEGKLELRGCVTINGSSKSAVRLLVPIMVFGFGDNSIWSSPVA